MRSVLALSLILFLPLKVSSSTIGWNIVNHGGKEVVPQDAYCMALNIYHESRSENLAGKFAVADVVMNRVYDRRYPDSICGVVYQAELKPHWKNPNNMVPVRNRCQFSWYCDGKSDVPVDSNTWLLSLHIARDVLQSKYGDITEGSTHYHSTSVHPYWADSLTKVVTVDQHIFYK